MTGVRPFICLIAAGVALPAWAEPVHYKLDPDHTYPSLEVPHMGISHFRGRFTKTRGELTLDRDAHTGDVNVEIDASSLDMGPDNLESELRGGKFLDVEKYPTITYRGPVKFEGGTPTSVNGQLTLLGVTKPVKLTITSFKCITHPMYKKEYCGADAEGEFNRHDFGMNYGAEGELGKVKVRIQVEGLRQGDSRKKT